MAIYSIGTSLEKGDDDVSYFYDPQLRIVITNNIPLKVFIFLGF